MRGDDFGSFLLERRNPIVHPHGRTRVRPRRPKIHAGDLEEIAELLISQFEKQLCEEDASRLADARVSERPSERSAEMADAPDGILPNWRVGPSVEIHTPWTDAIEGVCMPERLPNVVQEHERLCATPALCESARDAEQTLLVPAGVRVLHEHSQQFQRIPLPDGRTALRLVNQVQFLPRPACFPIAVLQFNTLRFPLDYRRIEHAFAWDSRALVPGIGRTSATRHTNGIGTVGGKS